MEGKSGRVRGTEEKWNKTWHNRLFENYILILDHIFTILQFYKQNVNNRVLIIAHCNNVLNEPKLVLLYYSLKWIANVIVHHAIILFFCFSLLSLYYVCWHIVCFCISYWRLVKTIREKMLGEITRVLLEEEIRREWEWKGRGRDG